MSGDRPAPGLRPLTAPLDALWHLAASPKTAAVLMALAAAVVSLGLVLPQAPIDAGQEADLQHWLASLQVQRGAWVVWPAQAGLLSLHATPGFRLLWAALGFAALVAAADVTLAWREQTAGRGLPWRMLAHVGLLVLLVGFALQLHWGWEQERLLLGSGAAVAVGPAADGLYVERAGGGTDNPGELGLLWRQGGKRGEARLQAGRPLILGPRSLHLLRAGQAVRLRLVDSGGQTALLDDPSLSSRLQPELTLRFRPEGGSRYVSVPARDWVVRIAYQPAASGGSPFSLWVYRGLEAASLAQTSFAGDGELPIGEFRLRWQVLPYAELRAAFQPAFGLWAGGWLLLCVGLALSLGDGLGQAGDVRGTQRASGRSGAPGRLRARGLWCLATLLVGCAIWLAAGGLQPSGDPLAAAGYLVLACSAAVLLLGATGGLLDRSGLHAPVLQAWPGSVSWGLLGWTVAGGVIALAGWAADGTLWRWQPAQSWWALTWCVLAATRHLRGAWRQGVLPGLVLAACLATWAVLAGALPAAPTP